MKKGLSQQIPMKPKGSLGNTSKNLYSNKFKNLEAIDKFIDAFNQPRLNEEENINYLTQSITDNEIEGVMKSLPTRKAQDLTDSLLNSTRPLKKN
jgi:hypothetical protein